MPPDLLTAAPRRTSNPSSGGWAVVHPAFDAPGLATADDFLNLPGEVVSGHPDRHVLRVEPTPGRVWYLKRQHRVGWRERSRNRLAGYGWVSKCEREAATLGDLAAAGLPAPRWLAYGADESGRAFLLVEELTGAVELRTLLADNPLSLRERARLAERIGRAVADLHAAGFDTPDLTAKHLFVDPDTFAVTVIDWQSSRRGRVDPERALASLTASLAEPLASPRDRLRALRAYLGRAPFREAARRIDRLAAARAARRSVRDQRQAAAISQRLVWVAGEAVCAVPDVAADWPSPAVAPPFYGDTPPRDRNETAVTPRGWLVRGTSFDPPGRFVAWVRGRPWRSPEVTLGRVLFHLERYGVAAPRLLAFGQRFTGPASAESFALYDPPDAVPLADWLRESPPPGERRRVCEMIGATLRQLHDAGCVLADFAADEPPVWVSDDPSERVRFGAVRAVRIVRRAADRRRLRDLRRFLDVCGVERRSDRARAARGYLRGQWSNSQYRRPMLRAVLFPQSAVVI